MEHVLYIVSLLGVLVSAISGALAAGRKRFDWLGVVVMATVTAIGGGTLRDVLLDRHPIFWIRDTNYVFASLLAAALTLAYVRFRKPPRVALLVADALGLAFFTISGAQVTELRHLHPLVIVLMGTITGAAGGVLRDLLSGESPLIFHEGELYATASIAGAALYLLAEGLGLPRPASALLGMSAIAGIRFAAILWRIRLPIFQIPDDLEPST